MGRHVAFSDESRFLLHLTDGRWPIRRETSDNRHHATSAGREQAGRRQHYDLENDFPIPNDKCTHSLGALIGVADTMVQFKYAAIVSDHAILYMEIPCYSSLGKHRPAGKYEMS